MIDWIFPPTYKSYRSCPSIEVCLAALVAARSYIWLRTHCWTAQAKRVLNLFDPDVRCCLQNGPRQQRAPWSKLFALQALLISGSSNVSCVYQWWSVNWRYTGFGQSLRKSFSQQGGLSRRLLEHLYCTIKNPSADGHKLRYRLARHTQPGSMFFLIVSSGPEIQMRAKEWLDIRVSKPRSNGFHPPSLRCHVSNRCRPPKEVRKAVPSSVPREQCQDLSHRIFRNVCRKLSQRILPCRDQLAMLFDGWRQQFDFYYIFLQKKLLVEQHFYGPLWIFDPHLPSLFMLYLTKKKCSFRWASAEQFDSLAPVRFALMVDRFASPYRRKKARSFLEPWLLARGFPSFERHVIRMPSIDLCRYSLCCFAAMVRALNISPLEKAWARSRVSARLCKPRYFSDTWDHVKLAKSTSFSKQFSPPSLCEGPMFLVKKNWRIPVRTSPEVELELCHHSASDVCKGVFGRPPSTFSSCTIPAALKKKWQVERATSTDYEDFVADFSAAEVSFVPDDKNKKWAWAINPATYQLLLCTFACLSSSWALTSLPEDVANRWLVSMLGRILGTVLSKRLGVMPGIFLLPYCYITLKSKCWQGPVRTCKKANHSCVRKIVSYSNWPRRQTWRSLHRAWDFLLKRAGDSCDTWSLDDATTRLQIQLRELPRNPGGKCARCFRKIQGIQLTVGDAGQFFEVVAPAKAIYEAQLLQRRACHLGLQTTITVKNGKKRMAWWGPPQRRDSLRTQSWSFEEMLRGFAAAALTCLTSVGDSVFRLDGLPIGGLLSKAAACVTLGGYERRWRLNPAQQRQLGFVSPADWMNAVCHLRYTDDVILASHWYCSTCLRAAFPLIYAHIKFDFAEPFGSRHAWLDMIILEESGTLELNVKPFPAPPPWATCCSFLRSVFLGKFRRWKLVNPTLLSWQRATISLLFDLKQAHWPKSKIKGVLFSIGHPSYLSFVQFSLHALQHIFA